METQSPKIAYIYKDEKLGSLEIKKSANAWWMKSMQITDLMVAFAGGSTIKEACVFADISLDQYKYFVEKHPEFRTMKDRIEINISVKARMTIVNNLHNPKVARWWLSKKLPEEFGRISRKDRREAQKVLG